MAKYRLGWHKDSYLDYADNLDEARRKAVKIFTDLPTATKKIVPSMKIYVGKERYGEIIFGNWYFAHRKYPEFHKDFAYHSPAPFYPTSGKMLEHYSYRIDHKSKANYNKKKR